MRFDKRRVGKAAAYAGLAVLTVLLQTVFFRYWAVFEVKPRLAVPAVLAVAMWEGEKTGAVFGLGLGYLLDCVGGRGYYGDTILYALMGYCMGMLVEVFFRRIFLTMAAATAVAAAGFSLLAVAFTALLNPGAGAADAALWVALPETVYTSLTAPLVYFPVRAMARRMAFGEE